MAKRKIRVLLVKPGLDGHDRGARMVAHALRDAGMEVVFIQFKSPEEIVEAAIQESVDFIGISILSGAHNILLPQVMKLIKKKGIEDIKIIAGGTIPKRDVKNLENIGILKLFPQNVHTDEIVKFLKEQFQDSFEE